MTQPKFKHIPRICYACDTRDTYIRPNGSPRWIFNMDNDGHALHILCSKCGSKYYYTPRIDPEYIKKQNAIKNPLNSRKHLFFRGKPKLLKENPRIGVCNLCRAVVPWDARRTNIHHVKYDENDMLANTIELCARCHAWIHWHQAEIYAENRPRLIHRKWE